MLSVKAVYDGKELRFLEKINIETPQQVIVTFLNESEEEITSLFTQQISAEGGALKFLENPEEDIYSDKDLKVKY